MTRPTPAQRRPPRRAATVGRRVAVPRATAPVLRDDGALVYSLPIRLHSENNAREHWRARYGRRKRQRETVAMLIPPKPCALPCAVTMVRYYTTVGPWKSRRFDVGDNLPGAFKAIRDEVAGLLGVDDGGDAVTWGYDQQPVGDLPHSVSVVLLPRDPAKE